MSLRLERLLVAIRFSKSRILVVHCCICTLTSLALSCLHDTSCIEFIDGGIWVALQNEHPTDRKLRVRDDDVRLRSV